MRKFWWMAMVCALCSLQSAAQAQGALKAATPAEYGAFLRLYADQDNAFKRRDISFFQQRLASNFVARGKNGKSANKEQYIRAISLSLRFATSINSVVSRIERIGMRKNQAVVVVTVNLDYSVRDPEGKMHRITGTTQSMDTWNLGSRGWQMQMTQDLRTQVSLDGRVVATT